MFIKQFFSIVLILCSGIVLAAEMPAHFLSHFYTEVDATKIPVALVCYTEPSLNRLDIILFSNAQNQPDEITTLPTKHEDPSFVLQKKGNEMVLLSQGVKIASFEGISNIDDFKSTSISLHLCEKLRDSYKENFNKGQFNSEVQQKGIKK